MREISLGFLSTEQRLFVFLFICVNMEYYLTVNKYLVFLGVGFPLSPNGTLSA